MYVYVRRTEKIKLVPCVYPKNPMAVETSNNYYYYCTLLQQQKHTGKKNNIGRGLLQRAK